MKTTILVFAALALLVGCDGGADPSDPSLRGENGAGGITGAAGSGAGGAQVTGAGGAAAAGTGGAGSGSGGATGAGGMTAAAGGSTGAAGAGGAAAGTGGAGGGGSATFPACPFTGEPLQTTPCTAPPQKQLWLRDANGLHACDICTQGVDTSVLPCVGARLCVASCGICSP